MFTSNIINIIWQTELVRALKMICTVGFLQKLSAIDDVTKYHGIPVSRYFLTRHIIVGHFLISCIPRPTVLYGTVCHQPCATTVCNIQTETENASLWAMPNIWRHCGICDFGAMIRVSRPTCIRANKC